MLKSFKIVSLFVLIASGYFSQIDSLKKSHFTFSGYADLYYCFDFNEPINNTRENFIYNHNKHNEINTNLIFLKSNYTSNKFRNSIALMNGTYVTANLASEPQFIKNIFEANIGFKLKNNLWIDAGVFPSHIGFESAVAKDNWNLTRSILAENSPYYESGIKITNTSTSEKTVFAVLLLNGWQKIIRPKKSFIPSLGTQLTHQLSNNLSVNHSSFIGNDTPDSAFLFRFFNNFYCTYFKNKFGFIAGFDVGIQQNNVNKNNYNLWFSPVVIIKYTVTNKFSLAGRVEYYSDKQQTIIKTTYNDAFDALGISVNMDYSIFSNLVFRLEGRALYSSKLIYTYKNTYKTNVLPFITTSLCANF